MKKDKKHRFTLVELICIVVIVTLLIIMAIIGASRVINNSKLDSKLAQEKLLIDACKSYINDNNDIAPKTIGDSINIDLSTLKSKNYLKEDIYNNSKKSCMGKSYIRVYKLNRTEYTYLPYLYCGNEKIPENEEVPLPSVKVLFVDDNNETNNNLIFNNINESRIYLEINGGEDSFGRQLEIDTYSITISMRTKNNPNLVEYYTTGMVDANKKYTYTMDRKIMNFVDAYNATSISVEVVATNVLGGASQVISSAQANK